MRPGDAVVPESKMPAYMRGQQGMGGMQRSMPRKGRMPMMAGGGFIPTISHDYNENSGLFTANNPAVANGLFTSGDKQYTALDLKSGMPVLDKLKGTRAGYTPPGAGGQSVKVKGFDIGKMPATVNIRDWQHLTPTDQMQGKGLYEDLYGFNWDDVFSRSYRQSPAGQRFGAARFG